MLLHIIYLKFQMPFMYRFFIYIIFPLSQTETFLKKVSGFSPGVSRPFCVEFACSPCVFLPRFPSGGILFHGIQTWDICSATAVYVSALPTRLSAPTFIYSLIHKKYTIWTKVLGYTS